MPNYVIVTDAANDLSPQMMEAWDVKVLPMIMTLGGQDILHYPDGRNISNSEFYQKLRNGELPTTAAVSPAAWIEAAEPECIQGNDVFLMPFSSGLSSTADNGVIAAIELREKYPDRQIEVVDTLCATVGGALIVRYASENRAKGMSLIENKADITAKSHQLAHYFTVDDLNHLHRGGRVSMATAIVGGALGIKPVLFINNEGKLESVAKARGRKKALAMLIENYERLAVDPSNGPVMISHGDCLQDAQEFAADLKKRFGCRDISIEYIGPIIGAHTGPGAITLCFLGKQK